jgi:hypothetical protein
VAAARDADRHDRHPRFDRQQEQPAFERRHLPIAAPRTFGKNDQRRAVVHQVRHLLENCRARALAVHEQVPGPAQVPPQKRESAERGFRDDAQLPRHRREYDRDVVDALVIRREDVAAVRVERRLLPHVHSHARRRQD